MVSLAFITPILTVDNDVVVQQSFEESRESHGRNERNSCPQIIKGLSILLLGLLLRRPRLKSSIAAILMTAHLSEK